VDVDIVLDEPHELILGRYLREVKQTLVPQMNMLLRTTILHGASSEIAQRFGDAAVDVGDVDVVGCSVSLHYHVS
jgi:hypothetical protein